jgi:hypothetical protein
LTATEAAQVIKQSWLRGKSLLQQLLRGAGATESATKEPPK